MEEDLQNALLDIEENVRGEDRKRQHLAYLNSLAAENDADDEEGCIICSEVYESGWIFEWCVIFSIIVQQLNCLKCSPML